MSTDTGSRPHLPAALASPTPPARQAFPRPHKSAALAGFTLIELMIVVAIIGILAAIAYPSYTRYVVKTRRSAAEGCLLQAAQYMERYHATYLSYSADGETGQPAPTLPACEADVTKHYAIALTSAAATYTVTATAKQGDAQASADAACATLLLDQTGKQGALDQTTGQPSSATCW